TARADLQADVSGRLHRALDPTLAVIANALPLASCVRDANRDASPPVTVRELAASFPALGETIRLIVTDWIVSQRELLLRLARDRDQLPTAKRAGSARIARIRASMSDAHDGGHTVTLLAFENGSRVVYKPRPCTGELLWFRLLRSLTDAGFPLQFRLPRIVERRRYHWMEFVPARACRSEKQLRKFYSRWGAQIGLAYVCQLADLHHENWTASGEHPVLVDAEMFGPDAWALRKKAADSAKLEPLQRMYLLPHPTISAVAPFDAPEVFAKPPFAWPRLNGRAHPPHEFVDAIVEGFDLLQSFLTTNHAYVGRLRNSIARAVSRGVSRVAVRSTAEYDRLLRRSLHPSRTLGQSSRSFGLVEACLREAPSRRIAEAEATALLRCSIPRFYSRDIPHEASAFFLPTEAEWKRCALFLRERLSAIAMKSYSPVPSQSG
ncbi:MAG TPA: type 2 lanthipeptide synthetase LanM, partial [Chthoniobacterales bacterium]